MLKLKKIHVVDTGPIQEFDVTLPFNLDGSPKPLVLVGENGTGKTTALSFIVDSLLQISAPHYDDVLTNRGLGYMYFRVRSHDVRLGAASSTAHLQYEFNGRNIHYVDRIGKIDIAEFRQRFGLPMDVPLDANTSSEKSVSPDTQDAAGSIRDGAYLFFPSGRREIPYWLQQGALPKETFSTRRTFDNELVKNIVVDTASEETATWIMDGLLDRAAGYRDPEIEVANQLLRVILGDSTAHFAVGARGVWPRLQIYTGVLPNVVLPTPNPRRLLIPSLAHLSAGQSMLLSMFGTIANHGNKNVVAG